MLGSLLTMLCVSDVDVDGRLLRPDDRFRVGVSIVLRDEFIELDEDADKLPDDREANADGFVRFVSNESPP